MNWHLLPLGEVGVNPPRPIVYKWTDIFTGSKEQCLDKFLPYVKEAFPNGGIKTKDLSVVEDRDFNFKSDGTFLTFEYNKKDKGCPFCHQRLESKCFLVYYGVSGGICFTLAALMIATDIDIKYIHKIAEQFDV